MYRVKTQQCADVRARPLNRGNWPTRSGVRRVQFTLWLLKLRSSKSQVDLFDLIIRFLCRIDLFAGSVPNVCSLTKNPMKDYAFSASV